MSSSSKPWLPICHWGPSGGWLSQRQRIMILSFSSSTNPRRGFSAVTNPALGSDQRAAESGVAVLVSTHYMDEAEQADRLVVMSRGRVAAAGSLDEVIGERSVVEVRAERWVDAFAALDHDGRLPTLSCTNVRVIGESSTSVTAELDGAGVTAAVRSVPATLDETMVVKDK